MRKGMCCAVGFLIGSVAGWFAGSMLTKRKLERDYQKDAAEVKEVYRKLLEEAKTEKALVEAAAAQVAEEVKTYANTVAAYTGDDAEEIRTKLENRHRPYVINPEEAYDYPDEDHVTLYFYRNGVVADETDRALSDAEIESTIGHESLKHFGQYCDDAVHVRNDERHTVYEILLSLQEFIPD